ncbi:hypothetical protein KCP77_20960 [Salmonella enterica subsp. enterica]|nr:hypothetical protein KCP77_20960 [Salmonella enterica subsp. enterica]
MSLKGPNGAKVAYDAPHADMDVTTGMINHMLVCHQEKRFRRS